MSKKYPLSLAPDYCSDWTPAEAIREILQNCLDDETAFNYSYDEVEETLYLTSEGVELASSTLLLGTTSKRQESGSVGGFGEGFKIAMLVLCREGHNLYVNNGRKRWVPLYEYSDLFDSQALVVYEEELTGNTDLTFIISNVSQDLMDEVTDKCLYLQDDLGEVLETEYGRILKDTKGKLYVGGLFVCTTSLQHSYDFHPQHLTLNRDRKAVDSWDLGRATARMWEASREAVGTAELLLEGCPDVKYLEYGANRDVVDACHALYRENFDGFVLADSYNDAEDLKSKGVEKVKYLGKDAFTSLVKSHDDYKEAVVLPGVEPEQSPIEVLEDAIYTIKSCTQEETIDILSELLDTYIDRGVIWE